MQFVAITSLLNYTKKSRLYQLVGTKNLKVLLQNLFPSLQPKPTNTTTEIIDN